MSASTGTGPYHHGDLPRALLDATAAVIEEAGPGAVSIRAVARRVGVSHAAPAHHFRDKTGLLTTFASEGFAHFTEHLQAALHGADPEARLAGCGRAYLAFAREHRAYFDVIFRPELVDFDDPELAREADRAFDVLVAAVQDCLEEPEWGRGATSRPLRLGDRARPRCARDRRPARVDGAGAPSGCDRGLGPRRPARRTADAAVVAPLSAPPVHEVGLPRRLRPLPSASTGCGPAWSKAPVWGTGDPRFKSGHPD